MKLQLPHVYPITDTRISGIGHVEQLSRFISGGATLVQLRDKSGPSGEFHDAAVRAIKLAHSHSVKIIINDRVDIALAAGADGVHLGQDDLSPIEARKLLGPNAVIGYSTHTEEQAEAALKFPIDYIAFGPVFSTKTKENADRVVGLKKLAAIRGLTRGLPLVAIGGIEASNLRSVLATGADSAAVISAVLSESGRIYQNVEDMLAMSEIV